MVFEVIAILAAILIVGSLTFKCVTVKKNIIMRVMNGLGSALYAVYGLWLLIDTNGGNGWAMVISNVVLLGFNVFHVIKLSLQLKKYGVAELGAEGAADAPTAADPSESDIVVSSGENNADGK